MINKRDLFFAQEIYVYQVESTARNACVLCVALKFKITSANDEGRKIFDFAFYAFYVFMSTVSSILVYITYILYQTKRKQGRNESKVK